MSHSSLIVFVALCDPSPADLTESEMISMGKFSDPELNTDLCSGQSLGSGRVGSVHAVIMVGSVLGLPSLVVKICRRKRFTSIAQEAWFYEELERLQDKDKDEDEDEDEDEDGCADENEVEDKNLDEFRIIFEYPDEDENNQDIDYPYEAAEDEYSIKKLKAAEKEYENQVPGEGPILSIILLERLGGNIPIGVPVDSIRDDVYELFHDLSRLGIEILDIRWSNILAVSDNAEMDSDLPGRICPNHGHAHRWRIIDFDYCRKTDAIENFTDNCNNVD
ncbi:hypothetical protein Clacol_010423 [Clathrus columnatus]|uniref:Uncharacterized protein n=1 Tax=Clathrus columnatus TaxID=1419009 RepID=A0AAV5ARJ2_9AGAM|nr:hypothetical protein Clacol_010423 [Clathrus columnatus]